eukprot:6549716-Pyramimonas_sp.AAC.1
MSSRRHGGSNTSPLTTVRTTSCLLQGKPGADCGGRQPSTYAAGNVDGRRASSIQGMATALNGKT